MNFEYYYGTQADQFSFIRIPRILLLDEAFSALSLSAKVLYSVLLDRMGLSMKNKWLDEENKVYIIYQITEIQSDLGFSKKKAMDYLTELEKIGLIEKKKRGFGLPNIIYVKSFMVKKNIDFDVLLHTYSREQDLVEEIYQLILETVQTEKDMIRIAGEYYPAGFVKGKLLKLNYSHIEYVLECMDKNTTKVRNIKQYLLAALFNAPSTIGSYYKAAVNHDMPQYAN